MTSVVDGKVTVVLEIGAFRVITGVWTGLLPFDPRSVPGFQFQTALNLFQSGDCTANVVDGWITAERAVSSLFFDTIRAGIVTGDEAIPDARRLYVATGLNRSGTRHP